MEVRYSISTVDETLECLCLRCCTGGEMDQSLREGRIFLQWRHLKAGMMFKTERLQRVQNYTDVLRLYHVLSQSTERISWQIRRFLAGVF